jgi:exodeoxyribonuclease V gamma subunit
LPEWTAFADEVLDRLVAADGAFAASIPRVRDVLATFADESADRHGRPIVRRADHTSRYSASAVATLLEHRLEDVLGSPGRLGGITVAPLSTGWVRPARVIALLGMDDELFPRRGGAPWFDRLAEHPEPGDPDERGEQLQTVFEAVMLAVRPAAGDVHRVESRRHDAPATQRGGGRTRRRGARCGRTERHRGARGRVACARGVRHAAAAVQCTGICVDHVRRAPALCHPSMGSPPPTATRLREPVAELVRDRTRATADVATVRRRELLPLSTLLRFLRRPADEILSRLGVRLADEALLLEDVLPLTVSRLDEAVVVRDMAESLLLGGTLDGQFEALRHRDRMPPAQLGHAWAHDAERRARALAARAHAAIDGQPRHERALLRVTVGETVLSGTIDTRHGDRLLFMRDGKHRPHQLTSAFATLCFAHSPMQRCRTRCRWMATGPRAGHTKRSARRAAQPRGVVP